MTPLPRISGNDCIAALQRAGFTKNRQMVSHVILRRLDPYGMAVVPVHKELGPGVLRSIIPEAGMTVEEFVSYL
ncbi:type II toxin-antitoxin system HicA family toxin [soil metagenome]